MITAINIIKMRYTSVGMDSSENRILCAVTKNKTIGGTMVNGWTVYGQYPKLWPNWVISGCVKMPAEVHQDSVFSDSVV